MFVINTSSDVLEQFGENINLVQGPVHVRSALRRGSDQFTLLAGPDVADGRCNLRHASRSGCSAV
jgi:hypothetical protein